MVESLWVYHYKGRGQLRSGIDHPHQLVDNWVAGHGIVDDDRRPLHLILSRLRKTHKALWYLKTEGHMARFAVGHTPEIAARHYADIPGASSSVVRMPASPSRFCPSSLKV